MADHELSRALACLALLCIDQKIFANESFFSIYLVNALSKSGVSLFHTRPNISVIVFQFLGQFCVKKILSGHQCQCQVY